MIPPLFGKQEVGIWRVQKHFPRYGVPIWSLWPNIRFLPSIVAEKIATKNEHIQCMFNVYKNQQSRQRGSRNLTGPKTLSTIWGTYMKLVTKYQISAINSCWEKCDEKCAYWFMFNVYKNQLSRQTGSRNMTGPKTLPTIWYTYMTKNILDGRTEVKQYTPSPFRERGYNYSNKSLKVRLSNNYRNA
jgi:hypothetical protein